MRKVKISVIILTFNEEEVIASAIDSVRWANEIIVIDSGSVDDTELIVKKMGVRFIRVPFTDFASQRNISKQYAKYDLILYLDADETIDQDLQKAILLELESPSGNSAFLLTRINYYLGKKWPSKERLGRLFYSKSLKSWKGVLHESPLFEGQVGVLSGAIIHHTHRTLEAMLKKTIVWSDYEAKLRFDQHHPPVVWWRIIRVMLTAFYISYFKQKGYKVGTTGFIESIYQSYSIFITYGRLWEMQQKKLPG